MKDTFRQPGIIRTIEGTSIDLTNFKPEDVNIRDIAWGTGRTLRFGGHIRHDHTVAHHSVVMSYYVPKEYALEALLHDAAEAYLGDIIWPVKALFPQISEFEDELLHIIMTALDVPHQTVDVFGGTPIYVKSPVVEDADNALLQHECFGFGRPGVYHDKVEEAWLHAAEIHDEYWYAPQYVFLQRFQELIGQEDPHKLDLDLLTQKWFPEEWEANQAMKEAEALSKEDLDELMQGLDDE